MEQAVFWIWKFQENLKGESVMVAILLSCMEGELLYLRIFSLLSWPSNFVQCVVFLHGLQPYAHLGYQLVITYTGCAE